MIVHVPTNRHNGGIYSGISMVNSLKKTGSKTDLKPCIFFTNRKPFFPISQIGNITQHLNKKVISIKSLPTYSEMSRLLIIMTIIIIISFISTDKTNQQSNRLAGMN